jgi:hypothetical protein
MTPKGISMDASEERIPAEVAGIDLNKHGVLRLPRLAPHFAQDDKLLKNSKGRTALLGADKLESW